MTTPNPAPSGSGAQSGAGNKYMDLAGLMTPPGGSGGSSIYGLGSVSSQPVVLGDLIRYMDPKDVTTDKDGNQVATAENVMKALVRSKNPQVIAQLQSYMYKAGLYGSKRWADINLGVINPEDISALGNAVQDAALTGADLSDYLRRQAAWGVYTGAPFSHGRGGSGGSSASAGVSGTTLTLDKPDPKAIGATIDREFQKMLGHKPTAAERAGFIAAYSNAYQQVQIDNYNRQIAAVTKQSGAAGPDAGSTKPPVYMPLASVPAPYTDTPENRAALHVDQGAFLQTLRNLPDDVAGQGIDVPALSEANYTLNRQNKAKDDALLALADQPLPGMPGYTAAGAAGGIGSFTTVQQQQNYDPVAYADEWIQQHHTAESGAHSATDVFSMFLNLLHGGMQ